MEDPTVRLLAGLVMLLLVAVVGIGTLLALIAVRRKHDRRQRLASHRTQRLHERRTPVPDAWTEAGLRFRTDEDTDQSADEDDEDDDAPYGRDAPEDDDTDTGPDSDAPHRPPDDRR